MDPMSILGVAGLAPKPAMFGGALIAIAIVIIIIGIILLSALQNKLSGSLLLMFGLMMGASGGYMVMRRRG